MLDRHFHVVRKSKETTDNNDKNNEKAKETKAESIKERKLKTDRKTVRLSPFVRSSNSDGDLSDSEKTKKNDTQKKMKKIPIVRYSDSEEDLFEDSESYENRVARSTSQSQQDESSSLSEEMEIGEDEEPCKIIMGPDSLGSDDIADIYPSYIQEEELAVIAEKRRKNLEGESETNAKVPRLSNAQEATPNDSPDPNIIDISSSQDSIDSISSTPTYLISGDSFIRYLERECMLVLHNEEFFVNGGSSVAFCLLSYNCRLGTTFELEHGLLWYFIYQLISLPSSTI